MALPGIESLELHLQSGGIGTKFNRAIKALGGNQGKANLGDRKRFVSLPCTYEGIALAHELICEFGFLGKTPVVFRPTGLDYAGNQAATTIWHFARPLELGTLRGHVQLAQARTAALKAAQEQVTADRLGAVEASRQAQVERCAELLRYPGTVERLLAWARSETQGTTMGPTVGRLGALEDLLQCALANERGQEYAAAMALEEANV